MRARITELQNALQERAEAAERLTAALESAKSNNLHMRQRVEHAQAAAAEQQATFETLLLKEKEAVDMLTKELSEKKVQEVALRAELGQTESSLRELEVRLTQEREAEEVLKNDVALTRTEAETLQATLDKRGQMEGQLLDKVDQQEQKIRDLKNQVNEKAQLEQTLLRRVQASEGGVKTLKQKLAEKAAAEQQLVRELEQAKIEFTQIAPSETVRGLQSQVDRAEASQSEYAGVLLNILRREGVSA